MKLLNKLERKFGRYAIHNLMYYVIILYALGFVFNMINPSFYYNYLMLDIDKVLHGQIWRLVTFLIQPIDSNILFLFISLYLYYMIGTSLERAWGAFRFNLYFLSGVLFNILAVVILYVITRVAFGVGYSYPISISYINQSMFFAFAVLFPEMQFLLFFIIPVKVKYLGYLYGLIMAYNVISLFRSGTLEAVGMGIAMIVALANFLIFFLMTRNYKRISPKERKRRADFQRSVRQGERMRDNVVDFQSRQAITRHKCAVCGRTELDDDELEFRFCSKCDGNYEYCMEHLYTHSHVKREQ